MQTIKEKRDESILENKDKFAPNTKTGNDVFTQDKIAKNMLDNYVGNMSTHDELANNMFTGKLRANKCDDVKIDIHNGYFVENNCNTYKIYECQIGSNEILNFENEAADRARSLAAFQRLYCIDYENGTWL